MALSCRNFGFNSPFDGERRIFEFTEAQIQSVVQKAAHEKAHEKIEASKLFPDTIGRLNDTLDNMAKKTPEKLPEVLGLLDSAITELKLIEELCNLSDPKMKAALLTIYERRNDVLGDLNLSTEDIKALAQVRLDAAARIELVEAHQLRQTAELKKNAFNFIKEKGTDTNLTRADRLKSETTYLVSFKDPITGIKNTFAENNIILGDIMKSANLTQVTIHGKLAYLWDDGKTYNVPKESTQPKSYVKILEGDEFTTPAKVKSDEIPDGRPEPISSPTPKTAPSRLPPPNVGLAATTFRSPTYEAKAAGSSAPENYKGLLSMPPAKITSGVLRGENSWEEIQNLKFKENGQKVYDAIQTLASLRTDMGDPTSNRAIWEELRGVIAEKRTITLNEIVRAAYGIEFLGKNFWHAGEWLVDAYGTETDATKKTQMKTVLDAASTLLTTLPLLKDTGVDADTYKEMRAEGIPAAMVTASEYTDEFLFDRDSYGPMEKLGVFRSLSFLLSKKDRPVITEDNWTDPVSRRMQPGAVPDYGEIQFISQARAWDKLMETGTPEEFVKKLNHYRAIGEAQIQVMKAFGADRGIKLDLNEEESTPFTLPDVTAKTEPTEAQKMAVHYGMMLEAQTELRLYQEARQVVQGTAGTTGFLGAAASVAPGENKGTLSGGAALTAGVTTGIAPGTAVDAGLFGMRSGGNNSWGTRGGLSTKRKIGKEGRAEIGAGIHGSANFTDEGLGVDANAYYSHKIGRHGVWSAKGQAEAALGTKSGAYVGAEIGVERDLNSAFEVRLAKFKEQYSTEIQAAKDSVKVKIDAISDIDSASKETLKKASDYNIDLLIEQGVMEDWIGLLKQLKNVEDGVRIGVGWQKEKGLLPKLQIGPYITFAFGVRPRTTFVRRPVETTGTPGADSEWIPEDSADFEVPIPNTVLWTGDGEEAAAIARAETMLTAAREARNTQLAGQMKLTPNAETGFDEMTFEGLNGVVRLYPAPGADLEVIADGNSISLNAAIDANLNVKIREYGAGQGGGNEFEVFISTNPSDTPESIKAASPSYLTWAQTLDGDMKKVSKVGKGANDKLYIMGEASTLNLAKRTTKPGDLAREVQWDALTFQEGAKKIALEQQFPIETVNMANAVAEALINSGVNYDTLALGNDEQQKALDRKIVAQYLSSYPTQKAIESSILVEEIYMVRQHAMELCRPTNLSVPIAWNTRAFKSIPNMPTTVSDDFEKNLTGNRDNLPRGQLPEGSEFFIYVNHNGQKQMQGYYSQSLHGDIRAMQKLEDPNAVAAVQALAWQSTPLNSLKEGATFDEALATTAGGLLMANAEAIYGLEKGKKLKDKTADPALKAEFIQDVKELIAEPHQTMVGDTPVKLDIEVYSGLYDKCLNLVIAKNFVLKYAPQDTHKATISVKRERMEEGMRPQIDVRYRTATVGVIPGIGGENKEQGNVDVGDQANPGDTTNNESTSGRKGK